MKLEGSDKARVESEVRKELSAAIKDKEELTQKIGSLEDKLQKLDMDREQ